MLNRELLGAVATGQQQRNISDISIRGDLSKMHVLTRKLRRQRGAIETNRGFIRITYLDGDFIRSTIYKVGTDYSDCEIDFMSL